MKPPKNITRRHLFIAAVATFMSAGVALAAMCHTCGGSGTASSPCVLCKGTGLSGQMKCPLCKGKGFPKCVICNGSGQN